jgi:Domain of unknown function (DUF4136)
MLNTQIRALVAGAVATALLGACTTVQVTTDHNPKTTIAVCHTYTWAGEFRATHGEPQAFANPVNESRLRDAIAANLQAKGIQPAAAGASADCNVGYGIGVRNVVEGEPYAGWGYGWGWRHGYWGGGWGDYSYAYSEGRIAVDIYEAQSHQPIWHASANADVTKLTGDEAQAKINAAVAAIFTKFP